LNSWESQDHLNSVAVKIDQNLSRVRTLPLTGETTAALKEYRKLLLSTAS
jgi:hypothetical protein